MKSSIVRRSLLWLTVAVTAAVLFPVRTMADAPYATNYRDSFDRLYWLQSAYYPVQVYGRDLVMPDPDHPGQTLRTSLSQPKDMHVDKNDHMYVADTGNNRIVELDENGAFVRHITLAEEDVPLSAPQGVFVDNNGDIYVADSGNKRVLRLDRDGRIIREYGRPESRLIPDDFKYDPIKLVVDKRGYLYIVTLGGYQGLLQLDKEGEFVGFFGANQTDFSAIDAFKRLVYTREMYARELSKLPGSITNVDIDDEGFIYTVTREVEANQVKKLNVAGKDLLAANPELADSSFGEFRFRQNVRDKPQLIDVTVDKEGNMTVIDTTFKMINQYDMYGNLLFFWSGAGEYTVTKFGIARNPSAVETNSANDLLLLDEDSSAVQMFRLSEFGALVHQANRLTMEGRYEESEPYWTEALRQNAFYTPALLGLAKSAYKRGDYSLARDLFLEAGDQQGYSEAFWQLRLIWFQRHFALLMNIAIAALAAFWLYRRLARTFGWRPAVLFGTRMNKRLLVPLTHMFYVLRHPIDGFAALRYEGKGGLLSSAVILTVVFASLCVNRLYTSFVFNQDVVFPVGVGSIFLQFAAMFAGWVVSNYLISNIYRGEGRFRDVVYGSVYALTPLIWVGLPLTLLSNALTLSEAAIFGFLQTGMYVWIGMLLFWKVQSTHNYLVGETIVNITLTLLTMILLGVLVFITFGLSKELFEFVYSVFQEVSVR